jgi:hypothetical protein
MIDGNKPKLFVELLAQKFKAMSIWRKFDKNYNLKI